tara:strand:- start:138 stop:302 length:165 start_codon:yes stop_codon:yes gene_type:complete
MNYIRIPKEVPLLTAGDKKRKKKQELLVYIEKLEAEIKPLRQLQNECDERRCMG